MKMKQLLSVLLILAMGLSLCACGGGNKETQASPTEAAQSTEGKTEGSAAESSAESTEAETQPAGPAATVEEAKGKKVADIDRELLEQAVVQTAMAYYYKNPNCQYNMTTTLTNMARSGSFLDTQNRSPESITADNMFYSHCRSFCSEIYREAFDWELPSLKDGWIEGFNKTNMYGNSVMSLVMQYTQKPEGKIWGLPAEQTYRDIDQFLKDLKAEIRPGDIVFGEKNETTNGGHVLLYLGDVFGDGDAYCLHSWPVGGGIMNDEGVNKWEPNGSATLQKADDVLFRTDTAKNGADGTPNWSVAAKKDDGTPNMYYFWVIRPLQNENLTKSVIPARTLTRLQYPFLSVEKDLGLYSTDNTVPGEIITVNETVTSHRNAAYKGVSLSEKIPAGTKLVAGSVTAGGSEKNGVISWSFDVAAGKSVTVSYKLEVTAQAGESIFFEAGLLNDLPTRSEEIKVGVSHLTAAQKANLAKVADRLTSELKPGSFEDLAYVNRFYQTVLGMELDLPGTVSELTEALFKKIKPSGSEGSMLTPKTREEVSDPNLFNMEVRKNVFGYGVYLEDYLSNTNHFLDLKQEFYQPGDVFVVASHTANPIYTVSAANLKLYVYLGNGKLVEHSADTTKVVSWASTVQKDLLAGLFVVLRPAQVLDAAKAPGANDEPGEVKQSENLALKAKVTTTYDLVNGGVYPLSMINDGKHAVDGTNMGCLKFKKDGEILFDLGEVCEVTGYNLWMYEWWDQYGLVTGWEVYASEDGKNFAKVGSGSVDVAALSGKTKYASDVKGGEPDGETFDKPVSARYIKLVATDCYKGSKTDCAHIRFYDVDILGYAGGTSGGETDPTIRNLAVGGSISTTYGLGSFHSTGAGAVGVDARFPMQNIIDGDHSPNASTGCRYLWSPEGYILLDLGKEYTLTGYRIYNYEWPYQWCINKAWTVYGSVDGTSWTQLAHEAIDCSGFNKVVKYYSDVMGGEPNGEDFDDFRARYVKLVIDEVFVGEGTTDGYELANTSSCDVRLYELEVLGY